MGSLQVLTSYRPEEEYLAFDPQTDKFYKVDTIEKIILVVRNFFYTIFPWFSKGDVFANLRLRHVATHLKDFLPSNYKTLTKEKFDLIQSHFDFLHSKAKKKEIFC